MIEAAASNADLAQQIYAGDKRAEAELFKRFGTGIRQILVKVTGSLATAEDLCQETLIVTLQRLRTQPLEDPSRLPAFVAQTARNLGLAEMRKARRRRTDSGSDLMCEVPDLALGQESEAQAASAAAAIRAVLAELRSSRDRALLIRYYLQGDEKSRICKDLGMTEATFNVVLFRARTRFQELLERRGMKRDDLIASVCI